MNTITTEAWIPEAPSGFRVSKAIIKSSSIQKWLDQFMIRTKIQAAVVGSTILLWVVVGALLAAVFYFAKQGDITRHIQDVDLSLTQASLEISRADTHLGDFTHDGSAAELSSARTALSKALVNLGDAAENDLQADSETTTAIQILNDALREKVLQADALTNDVGSRSRAQGVRMNVRSIAQDLASLSAELNDVSNAKTDALFSAIFRVGAVFGIVVLIIPALILLAGRIVVSDVAGMIDSLTRSMQQLSEGNTGIDIPGISRRDEIGSMSRALTVFRDTARREIEQQESFAVERDEARKANDAALRKISSEFEQSLGMLAKEIAEAATELDNKALFIANGAQAGGVEIEKSAKKMHETSERVTSAAAASDEFSLSITEISHQATSSADLARDASAGAADASDIMQQLSRQVSEISYIVETIHDVAKRTNLLALNASIEAARSGETGRGFAVVASEVKELAQQTAHATNEIGSKIAAIQDSANSAIGAASSALDTIGGLATSSFAIAAAVDQQTATSSELARAIDQSARNTQNISRSLTVIDDAAKTAGASAREMASATRRLRSHAVELQESASIFSKNLEARMGQARPLSGAA